MGRGGGVGGDDEQEELEDELNAGRTLVGAIRGGWLGWQQPTSEPGKGRGSSALWMWRERGI